MLFLRYLGFLGLSLAVTVAVIVPLEWDMSNFAMTRGFLILPIYCCLSVFILIGFRPEQMRRVIRASPTKIDDLHLWTAPVLVLVAFLWAAFLLIGALALSGFSDRHPFLFLMTLFGAIALGVFVAIRVRQVFSKR